jgi:hypothetical protein
MWGRGYQDWTQQKKWDEMQAKRKQWGRKGGHPGPPDGGDQQTPPPQP